MPNDDEKPFELSLSRSFVNDCEGDLARFQAQSSQQQRQFAAITAQGITLARAQQTAKEQQEMQIAMRQLDAGLHAFCTLSALSSIAETDTSKHEHPLLRPRANLATSATRTVECADGAVRHKDIKTGHFSRPADALAQQKLRDRTYRGSPSHELNILPRYNTMYSEVDVVAPAELFGIPGLHASITMYQLHGSELVNKVTPKDTETKAAVTQGAGFELLTFTRRMVYGDLSVQVDGFSEGFEGMAYSAVSTSKALEFGANIRAVANTLNIKGAFKTDKLCAANICVDAKVEGQIGLGVALERAVAFRSYKTNKNKTSSLVHRSGIGFGLTTSARVQINITTRDEEQGPPLSLPLPLANKPSL